MPRAPTVTFGNLEDNLEDGLEPGPSLSHSHSHSRYTGAAADLRVSRVAQRRGSCSTMILNELNPQQAGTRSSAPSLDPVRPRTSPPAPFITFSFAGPLTLSSPFHSSSHPRCRKHRARNLQFAVGARRQ